MAAECEVDVSKCFKVSFWVSRGSAGGIGGGLTEVAVAGSVYLCGLF